MSNTPYIVNVLFCNRKGKRAVKKFIRQVDKSIEKIDYDLGDKFTYEVVTASNQEEFFALLASLAHEKKKFVIFGQIKENMDQVVYRRIHGDEAAFDPAKRFYVMLDLDKVDCPEYLDPLTNPIAVITWIQDMLPAPFRGVSCYYQFSASQNVPYKDGLGAGKVSVHLWFCCDKPVGCDEWKRYFNSVHSPVDKAIYSPVHALFTANPVFENMPDPLPDRNGVFRGERDVVIVPKIPEPDTKKQAVRSCVTPVVDEENRTKALELILPYYKEGGRNRLSGALAATLYRGGWQAENAADFVRQLAEKASDEETEARYKNAICICNSVDQNLPAQGIPTLQKEFNIKNIDEILSLLCVGDNEVNKAISKLGVDSTGDEIKGIISMFLHLSKKEQNRYIARIIKITERSKDFIYDLIDEVMFERNYSSGIDIPDITMKTFLSRKYANGAHFLRASDGRYYFYNLRHWEYLTDDLVKKGLLPYVRETLVALEIGGVSTTLKACMEILKGETPRVSDPFRQTNRDIPPVINCLNGEVWFDENGNHTLKPHRPESYLRNCLNVKYDPSATSPMFDETLLEIFSNSSDPQDMFRHFLELAGYICQPWRKHAIIVLLYGRGCNGKTSLMKIITRILGDNAVMSDRMGDIDGEPFKIGALDGKLMLLDDDVNSHTRLSDGFLKKISEEKLLTGQHKHKDPFDFVCRAVPVMLANDYPLLRDSSWGMERRCMVIPFNRTFNKDEKDVNKFDNIWEAEASGILNHIIRGFETLRRRGDFKPPFDCIAAQKKWFARANILRTFIEEECIIGDEHRVHLGDFYESFEKYCRKKEIKYIPDRPAVKEELESLDYRIKLNGGKDAVWGLRLSCGDYTPSTNRAFPDLRIK